MNSRAEVHGLTRAELQRLGQGLPGGNEVARELYRSALLEGPAALAAHWNAARLAPWRERLRCDWPTLVRRQVEDSAMAGVEKVVLGDAQKFEYECVRVPMGRGREALCLSTQIGCAMACTFCETGRMGRLRSLSAAEIVAPVVLARTQWGWNPTQIVFMGMGEPLDNTEQLIQALRVLTDRSGLNFAQERLTICTIGRRAGLQTLRELGWKRLNLSISLNAADDEKRARLMPATRALPLGELQALLCQYRPRPNFRFGVHWCLLPGINDQRADAEAIAAWCAPLGRVLVQVIPYNPGSAPLTRAPSEHEVAQFVTWLRELGVPTRRRVTKGRALMAACGQLGNPALRRTLDARSGAS